MSADNGYILRRTEHYYALQEYSASADGYPPIEKARLVFNTVDEAVRKFEEIESDPLYIVEYGLTVRIKDVTPVELPECVTHGCQCSADCRFQCMPQEVYEKYGTQHPMAWFSDSRAPFPS